MSQTRMTIGHLAKSTGCKVQTIRYYEEIGLMPEPMRSEGNQRLYGHSDVERLAFIRHSRELGFPLPAIRELLSLTDDPSQTCEAADHIARAQLEAVEHRIQSLQALRTELKRMIKQCHGGSIADCQIIEILADHSKCLTEEHQTAIQLSKNVSVS
jgi:Cu(I)-responsive transcriptional regulator